jgi:FixJ family two-component response regulator
MRELKPTVFILHDDAAIVRGFRALMESVQLPVETYVGIGSLLANLDSSRIGCLILDVRMREMSGIELCRSLRDAGIVLPVIFVTAYGDVPTAVKAMQEGAFDFLQRPFSEQYLLDRAHAALEKDRRDRSRMAERKAAAARFEVLSAKERQVLDLIISGRTSKVMARELGIGLKTVDFHRANIMRKVGVETVGELVCLLFKGGYSGASQEKRPRDIPRGAYAPRDLRPVRCRSDFQLAECGSANSPSAGVYLSSGLRERVGTAVPVVAEVESM